MMDVWQHRSHLKKIAVALLSIMIMLSLVQPVPTAYGESSSKLNLKKYGAPEKLLEPLGGATSIYDGATGIEDGTNVMYTTVKGQPALFQVIDMDNNKLLRSFPLTGMGESWHHEVAPDGTVYIATSWTLWAYSPVT